MNDENQLEQKTLTKQKQYPQYNVVNLAPTKDCARNMSEKCPQNQLQILKLIKTLQHISHVRNPNPIACSATVGIFLTLPFFSKKKNPKNSTTISPIFFNKFPNL